MLSNPFDIAGAIEKAITDLIALHRIDQWAKFLFAMTYTGLSAFLATCGGALMAHRSAPEAIGAGMCSSMVFMAVLFRRRNDLTKGMTVVLPASEAAEEIKTDVQVLTKN